MVNRWTHLALVIAIFMVISPLVFAEAPEEGTKTKDVILATTTSTQDSGLLDVLVPVFEKESG